MPGSSPAGQDQEARFHEAALEYLRYLREHRPEHFMEATPQATQRKITVESFDLVAAQRSDVQMFNELLIQFEDRDEIRRIVPDNMVVVHPNPLGELLSFNYPTQEARPFWVFEYVSRSNLRKDYEDSFEVYEALRIPYYLIFYPDTQDLSLFRLNSRKTYSSVKPGSNGRLSVPGLEMEVAILAGWVRYWFRGDLLPLPAELLHTLEQTRNQLQRETERAQRETERAQRETERADREQQARLAAEQEIARLRALLDRTSGNGSPSA